MSLSRSTGQALLLGIAIAVIVGNGDLKAEIIYQSGPSSGPFGFNGPVICIDQPLATRFTPDADYTFRQVTLLLIVLSPVPFDDNITVSLRTDDNTTGQSIPSDVVLESFDAQLPAGGVVEPLALESNKTPLLLKNVNYWLVLESPASCPTPAIWPTVDLGSNFVGIQTNGIWQTGLEAAFDAIVEGWPLGCENDPTDCNNNSLPDACEFEMLLPEVDCCQPSPFFCPNQNIVDCVCSAQPDCCLFGSWTNTCANIARDLDCGTCVQPSVTSDCNNNSVLDECEASGNSDADFDAVPNLCDNCPNVANRAQADTDGDGIGDVCEGASPVPTTSEWGCIMMFVAVLVVGSMAIRPRQTRDTFSQS